QPIIVENKPGASGVIAVRQVMTSPPDGHTILIGSSGTHALNPHLIRQLPYDAVRDFMPVTTIATTDFVVMVNPASKIDTLAELTRRAKQNPGKLTFGWGNPPGRVLAEHYNQLAGIQTTNVPYKSVTAALTDLMGGQIDYVVADTFTGSTQARDGRLVALTVTAGQRVPILPNVPTMAEAGVPGFDMTAWFAAFMPAGTPRPIAERMGASISEALKADDVMAAYQRVGLVAFPGTPDSLAKFVAGQLDSWGRVIKKAGIQPE
ncbi:MAG: tripartite tricarboxylate transporter substrate binding protein, partial [Burkholderiales bacterium]|nr:tripartite tricarboxylate transporter substrate binding protein [Burkholderiales bacterium]